VSIDFNTQPSGGGIIFYLFTVSRRTIKKFARRVMNCYTRSMATSKTSKSRLLAERKIKVSLERDALAAQLAVIAKQLASLDNQLSELGIAERVLASLGGDDEESNPSYGFDERLAAVLIEEMAKPPGPSKLRVKDAIRQVMPASEEMVKKGSIIDAVQNLNPRFNATTIGVELSRMSKDGELFSDGKGSYRRKNEKPADAVASSNLGLPFSQPVSEQGT
jgi:hypothetical protein